MPASNSTTGQARDHQAARRKLALALNLVAQAGEMLPVHAGQKYGSRYRGNECSEFGITFCRLHERPAVRRLRRCLNKPSARQTEQKSCASLSSPEEARCRCNKPPPTLSYCCDSSAATTCSLSLTSNDTRLPEQLISSTVRCVSARLQLWCSSSDNTTI